MQEMSLLQAHMIAFAAGFVLDIIIGDPHRMPHPVRWIGNLIAALDRRLLGELADNDPESEKRDRAREKRAGKLLVLCVVITTALVTAAVVLASYRIHIIIGVIIEAVLTCYLLAMTSLTPARLSAALSLSSLSGSLSASSPRSFLSRAAMRLPIHLTG